MQNVPICKELVGIEGGFQTSPSRTAGTGKPREKLSWAKRKSVAKQDVLLDDWEAMKIEETLLKLRDICRLKHLSDATEKSDAGWIQSYSREVVAMPSRWTSEIELNASDCGK